MADETTIVCPRCGEFAAEDRELFGWEQGAPVCPHCLAAADDEDIMALGFGAPIDEHDRRKR